VRTLRLQRAAQLLEKQVGGVSETAYMVGFDDAKYFSRLFKQVYGTLPSQYGNER
jgi:transcriptional regulator GlxA family with amidase domain